MTVEEYIKKEYGETWLTHEWMVGDVINAMEEYGKQMYNKAIDDAAASAEIGYTYGHGSEYIIKESILKLKK